MNVNCKLKIKCEDESINNTFFYSLRELDSHVNSDERKLKSVWLYYEQNQDPLSLR